MREKSNERGKLENEQRPGISDEKKNTENKIRGQFLDKNNNIRRENSEVEVNTNGEAARSERGGSIHRENPELADCSRSWIIYALRWVTIRISCLQALQSGSMRGHYCHCAPSNHWGRPES